MKNRQRLNFKHVRVQVKKKSTSEWVKKRNIVKATCLERGRVKHKLIPFNPFTYSNSSDRNTVKNKENF